MTSRFRCYLDCTSVVPAICRRTNQKRRPGRTIRLQQRRQSHFDPLQDGVDRRTIRRISLERLARSRDQADRSSPASAFRQSEYALEPRLRQDLRSVSYLMASLDDSWTGRLGRPLDERRIILVMPDDCTTLVCLIQYC